MSESGKIFLSSNSISSENGSFRKQATFAPPQCFASLNTLDDYLLSAQHGTTLIAAEDGIAILLPVVGRVACTVHDETFVAEAGSIFCVNLRKGETIRVVNPYETGQVNFLHYGIKTTPGIAAPTLLTFNINSIKNQLIPLTGSDWPRCFIGKFSTRNKAIIGLSNPDNILLATVVKGGFEINYRLLETRDSIALWDMRTISFEALSDDAVVFTVELPFIPGS